MVTAHESHKEKKMPGSRMNAAMLFAACAVLSANGYAHARLTGAVPMPNAVVNGSPHYIRLQFSERIEPRLSAISLADGAGHKLALGRPESEGNNGKVLTARINGTLGAGVYLVGWRAVSTDTHKTQGAFTFTVKAK